MDLFIFITLVILITVYVGWPYRSNIKESGLKNMNGLADRGVLKELRESRDALLNAIKDIEFDYEIGKLSEEDFNEMKSKYRWKTIELMKSIDRLEGEDGHNNDNHPSQSIGEVCPVCATAKDAYDRFCRNCGNQFQTPSEEL
jgi:hypothetical protein